MNRKNGLTLIELMFAIAIIGLVASLAIPMSLNAIEHAREKTCAAHLAAIEKAKNMLTLSALTYPHGQSLQPGAVFGEGNYTEENLMACIKNADTLDELSVHRLELVPGPIGTKPHYTRTRAASTR